MKIINRIKAFSYPLSSPDDYSLSAVIIAPCRLISGSLYATLQMRGIQLLVIFALIFVAAATPESLVAVTSSVSSPQYSAPL
jgi:hypothetical protein